MTNSMTQLLLVIHYPRLLIHHLFTNENKNESIHEYIDLKLWREQRARYVNDNIPAFHSHLGG